MNRRTLEPGVFVTDREVLDFVSSGKVRLNSKALRAFARSRGVAVPKAISADGLRKVLAALQLGPADLRELVQIGDTTQHAEEIGCHTVTGVDADVVRAQLEVVVDEFGADRVTYAESRGRFEVTTTFVDVDPGKTRLLSRVEQVRKVWVDNVSGRMRIRYEVHKFNEKVAEWLVALLRSVPKASVTGIDLTGITTSSKRTDFFLKLPDSLAGFTRISVGTLGIRSASPKESFSEGDDDSDLDEGEDDETDDLGKAEGVVKWIRFGGEHVEKSDLYKSAMTGGQDFSVAAIRWVAQHDKGFHRFEIEAKAHSVGGTTRLVYSVGGFQILHQETGKYRRAGKQRDEVKLLEVRDAIETGAMKTLAQLIPPPQPVTALPTASDGSAP